MAENQLNSTFALALATAVTVDSLLLLLRRKKLISGDEQHELYDSALLMLEQLQDTSVNSATIKAARQRLETFEKASRILWLSGDPK